MRICVETLSTSVQNSAEQVHERQKQQQRPSAAVQRSDRRCDRRDCISSWSHPRQAQAQERRTILDMLFGFGRRQPPPVYDDAPVYEPRQRQPQQQQRPKARKTQQKAKPAPVEPAPVVVEKLENAKKVLVVGDFVAGSLGDGLKTAFETTPGIIIETRANGSSGLVREDYFNWPENLLRLYRRDETGADHHQPRRQRTAADVDRRRERKFRTDRWLTEYTRRTEAFAALARKDKTPLLWSACRPSSRHR